MNCHTINGARNPVERANAATKVYVDNMQYKTATGTIPDADNTSHTLFTFPDRKTTNGTII